jgi:hypothetical protein
VNGKRAAEGEAAANAAKLNREEVLQLEASLESRVSLRALPTVQCDHMSCFISGTWCHSQKLDKRPAGVASIMRLVYTTCRSGS